MGAEQRVNNHATHAVTGNGATHTGRELLEHNISQRMGVEQRFRNHHTRAVTGNGATQTSASFQTSNGDANRTGLMTAVTEAMRLSRQLRKIIFYLCFATMTMNRAIHGRPELDNAFHFS